MGYPKSGVLQEIREMTTEQIRAALDDIGDEYPRLHAELVRELDRRRAER